MRLGFIMLVVAAALFTTAGNVVGREGGGGNPEGWNRLTLWYNQPASQWTDALPIGNGQLGAMAFGNVADERIQLNEDTLRDGCPRDTTNPEALAALPEKGVVEFDTQSGRDYVLETTRDGSAKG